MNKRTNLLDWLRLIGAFAVIVGHSAVLIGQHAISFGRYEIHTYGVILFFLVSGYLISGSWMSDRNFMRFTIKRAFRIMPALIIVILITVFIVGPLTTKSTNYFSDSQTWKYLWRNILLLPYHSLPGVFEYNTISAVNGSLWTLPVEVFMYVITPILVFLGRLACFSAAAILLMFPVQGEVMGFGLAGASSVIPFFLIGAGIKMSSLMIPNLGAKRLPADISYGVYLTAFPVQQLLIQMNPSISVFQLIALTTALAGILGVLSWIWIEKPMLALGHRIAAAC